ncbi:AAA family ATPase [Pyxidicoccus fallax]|uniref:AAA family ATPase n=1 Tax=Pyxidicoccus fallax TaxID=394095 RepID=A0A848LLN2_9BACT|nr:AAA family ATPase [Pyxidicoccus fallax]NMO18715.1 AAA family ATPase [Pyxidicoccus fallax]NPC79296.1 AAA family ATPase [Pyxidicoccus fallax]
MLLTSFRLQNYKSFLEHPPIAFGPGFNIITGKNNAGKTALIEGLTLKFSNKPHRSSKTVPTPAHRLSTGSAAYFKVAASREELIELMLNSDEMLFMPYPAKLGGDSPGRAVFDLVTSKERIEVALSYDPNSPKLREVGNPSLGLYASDVASRGWVLLPGRNSSSGGRQSHNIGAGNTLWLGDALGRLFISRLYVFRAERLNIGKAPVGATRLLAPDASNLPEVLGVLQGNPARFERYNRLVRRVFPQVEHVTVRPVDGGKAVEILIWNESPQREREDLAVPLSESGTGIGQVLAMLYVLVTADSPRTIVIDEPNSFLHPGAIRSLIEIFREHPQHQYIVSTHSSELIATSAPSTIHVLRKSDGVTGVEQVDAGETQQLRMLLLEVGTKLSDVFGADSVLWVEGKTEEICFPIIVEKMLGRTPGVRIVGVLHTGDFDAEDARTVFRVYERLTEGKVLLPPAVAFIFDRELRSESARNDLVRQSQGKVGFLNRRTYENYLLHPDAIAAVMNMSAAFVDAPIAEERIQVWLDAHSQRDKYYLRAKTRDFLLDVDAPKLLSDLFSELSEARLEYNKVEHSVAITEWLLEHKREALQEIADLLKTRLSSRLASPERS